MSKLKLMTADGGAIILQGEATAVDRTITLPGSSTTTLVTTGNTQTLTGKTLTSPTISGGTIDNAVIGGTTRAAGNFTTLKADGNVLVTSPAGLGYGTGAGGSVTQGTSKSTTVTLNKPCGQITMHNAALAANTSVRFQVSNSLVAQTDVIIAHTLQDGVISVDNYRVEALHPAAGQFYIRVTNITGVSLSEAVKINFAIIKGATS